MRDPEFYRHMISKRAAVKALTEINSALRDDAGAYFYGYDRGFAREYDSAVYAMAEDIRRLVSEVKEYRKLKAALAAALK
jgi:hypothetical protein